MSQAFQYLAAAIAAGLAALAASWGNGLIEALPILAIVVAFLILFL